MEYFLQEGEENFWIRWHAKQILHYLEGVIFSVTVGGSMSQMTCTVGPAFTVRCC